VIEGHPEVLYCEGRVFLREKIHSQNYLHGAVVLLCANVVVKIIGAVFKIPLSNLIGKEGIGIFNIAYNIYTALFVLSTAGLPVAVSKMIAEKAAKGQYEEAEKIFKVALFAFSGIGAASSAALLCAARVFTNAIGNPMAYYPVVAIAPALFFVSVMSTIRGYYQGFSNMYPTAISQVIEAFFKMVVGFGMAYILLYMGYGIEIAAAGAVLGVTIGTASGTLYLALKKAFSSKRASLTKPKTTHGNVILKELSQIALPVAIGASVISFVNLIDMMLVMNRLQDIGYSVYEANGLYGAYGLATTLANLPQTLTTAISISIIPAISAAFARRDAGAIFKTTHTAMRMTSIISLPAAAGLFMLAYPVLNLLYYKQPEDAAVAAPLLSVLSLSVCVTALATLSCAVLQALGRVYTPVFTMAAGGVLKLIFNFVLVGNRNINILGAPIGTAICYTVIAVLNLAVISGAIGRRMSITKIWAKPLIASIVMAMCIYVINPAASGLIGGKTAVLFSAAAGAVIYFIVLSFIKGIKKDDILLLPKGEKAAKLLKIR